MSHGPLAAAATTAAPTEISATVSLLYVLLQTFSALGLGYICVRQGLVDPKRGDLRALQLVIGRVALPLKVFETIAVSSLGAIDWGVVLACNFGKLSVFTVTFGVTYFAYRSREALGQRWLTATVFAFFVTASNDFAIGMPVMTALYGEDMNIYIAANVFIFQTVLQPMVMVFLEIGKSLQAQDAGEQQGSSRCLTFAKNLARGIGTNLIIIATICGLIYQGLGKIWPHLHGQIPHPLVDIITLWTQPFTMMFLFLNGAALTSARLGFWPSLLVIMKVVICAYISYVLAASLVGWDNPTRRQLTDFSFFYGTIPAGGAPLIFAAIYAPGSVDTIAAASLFCLILAGPVEMTTSVFLGTDSGAVNYELIHQVQFYMAASSAFCALVFVIFAVCSIWKWSFAQRVVAVYAVVVLIYEVFTGVLSLNDSACHPGLEMHLFGFFQNACSLLKLYLGYLLARDWQDERLMRAWVPFAVVLLALIPGLIENYPTTLHELCGQGVQDGGDLVSTLVFSSLIFAGVLGVALAHTLLAKGRRAEVRGEGLLTADADAGGESLHLRQDAGRAEAPIAVIQMLLGALGLRMFIDIIIVSAVMATPHADQEENRGGFTPMYILANFLEHGQGCLLLGAACMDRSLRRHLPSGKGRPPAPPMPGEAEVLFASGMLSDISVVDSHLVSPADQDNARGDDTAGVSLSMQHHGCVSVL